MDAQDFVVSSAPARIAYIPNFITAEEEQLLLKRIYTAPKPKWQNLSNRRLQQWGGIVGKKTLIADNNIPEWLDEYISRICAVKNTFPEGRRPNHVLINEYLPGQGIMVGRTLKFKHKSQAHTDGPAFFPLVSTITLGSHTLLKLYDHDEKVRVGEGGRTLLGAMLLQPRNLVLISEDAYNSCLHGIDEVKSDIINEFVFNRPADMELGTTLTRSTRGIDERKLERRLYEGLLLMRRLWRNERLINAVADRSIDRIFVLLFGFLLWKSLK